MKKSYIALSLILSQALCADVADIKTDLIADFYSNGTKGSLNVTKPKQAQSVQATSLVTTDEVATYGTDWYGSTSYLDVKTDDLTFSFNDGSRQATNLVFSDGLTIRNNIATNDANSKPQAKITITSDGAKLKTLSIGQTANPSNRVTLGSDVNLMIKNFNDVKIVSNLYVGANSVFDVSDSSIDNFTNDGGIVLEGKDSTLKVKDTLTNNGTIMMREGSKIESVQNLSIGSNPPATKQGSIIVQGSSEINSGANDLTITNQDITIQNIVSKKDNKVSVTDSTLTLKSSNANGTLTLGDSTGNKVVNIIGKIGNTDPSKIPDSEIPSGSEIGNLALDGFTTIEAKNVNFKNVNVTSSSVTSMTFNSGKLGLENTTIAIGDFSTKASATLDLNLGTTGSNPTIALTGQNTISATGTLTITGTYDFQGNGSLDLVGDKVALGNGSAFNATGAGGSPVIGVSAKSGITTNEFTLSNLTLQVIDSTITNTKMTLTNSTIEAINGEGSLADLSITKDSSATIDVSNGTSATLRGQNISIVEQTINLANSGDQKTSLTLQAESGGVTLDTVTISGKNTTPTNNALNLNTPLLTLKGLVTLDKLAVNANEDLRIVGTEFNNAKGLLFTNGTTIIAGSTIGSGTQYHSLTFTSDFDGVKDATDESQAYVSFNADTKLEASDFTFQNQNIQLTNQQSGVTLSLYAYGTGIVDSSSSPTYSDSGVFVMNNTTFTDGTGSTIKFFSGSGGSTLLPSNLTLKNVSITSCLINGTNTCTTTPNPPQNLNTLNLSSAEGVTDLTKGSINILGDSTITASKFVYGDSVTDSSKTTQGIGVDITVGSDSEQGNLTLTSTTASDTFIVGGNLTLNNKAKLQVSDNLLKIDLNGSKKLEDNTLSLDFQGGGITAIGKNGSGVTLKAKDFTFSNRLDSNGEVTASPFVKVQNTELNLNGTSATLDLVGTLYLSGDTNNEAKFKATNSSTVALTLHDINAEGKASVTQNQLDFSDSNIYVGVLKDKDGNPTNTMGELTIKDTSSSSDKLIGGKIASIALEGGTLAFQQGSDSASITLNADSTITSSGTSSLTLKTIKVGSDGKGLYSLNVTDGTFTLTEKTAGTQLGAITLGSEDSSISGAGAKFEYKNGTASSYQTLTLKGNLTSYGASSIIANSFTISAKDDSSNYAISSTGGTLTLQAQDTGKTLELTADLSLNTGGLKYVDKDGQNAELKFGSKSTISSSGDSSIEAKNLDLNGVDVSASEGTLTLKGISSSTKAGSVSVGNAGVLRLEASNSKLATLRVNDTINLSASVPYITPDEPLGNGVFGQVVAESVQFESQDKSPLITISLSQASSTSATSDSLFALREGGIMLIDTNSGIKKKTSSADYSNITLEDISSNLGEFTSISLQPYLKYGTDTQGKQIVEDLMLNLQVTQNTVDQLVESIKDSSKKEQMQSLLSSGSNALVIESIMNGDDNPLKAGMALYISSGNVNVVSNALEYITGAFVGLNDSLYASHKVAQELKMIKTVNVENRMVRGKNPHLSKLEVAQLVRKAVGVRYASSDDEILLEEESGVKDGELWASFDGAMSFSESMGNASVYGFSGGYDTLLGEQKNYLLGFYFGYGYGSYSANFATNNSHNVSLGFYSRMSFENNEVDLILSQSIGLNTTRIDYGATDSVVAQMLKQDISYNFYTTDIEARYGYVFSVGDKENPYYFRPFGGINFAMIVNSEGRGDGEAPIGMDSLITYQLGVSAGVEMRKYFGENYLYLLPVLEKGLLNDGSGTKIGFVGSQSISYNLPYTIDTGISMYLGGQGNVGDNVAISGAVGVKVGLESKEILTNWNVGVRYKF